MSTVARLCTEPALRRVDDFSGCASLAAFTDKIPREGGAGWDLMVASCQNAQNFLPFLRIVIENLTNTP